MTVNETTYPPGSNSVGNPEGYDSMARVRNAILVGQFIDSFV